MYFMNVCLFDSLVFYFHKTMLLHLNSFLSDSWILSYQMITLPPFDSLDLIRTLRMAGFGMLVSGPSLHLWFNFLSKILPKQDVLTTFKKMFIGQTIYAPIMNAVFYSVNSALQGIDIFFPAPMIHKLKVYT